MLSYQTIKPDTLELLRRLMAEPLFSQTRLVGGTALALQLGHRYKAKYPEYSEYRAMLSLTYFDDAEQNPMPEMFVDVSWEEMKLGILKAVEDYNDGNH